MSFIKPFPSWQQFQNRPDNRGLNVMRVKQKYLTEQNKYFQMIPPTPSFASAPGGAGSTDSAVSPYLYLLDDYPSSAGYSLRKLSSTYTGNAIRVRRTNICLCITNGKIG